MKKVDKVVCSIGIVIGTVAIMIGGRFGVSIMEMLGCALIGSATTIVLFGK